MHFTSVSMRVCFQKKIQIWKQRLSSSVLLNIQILISVPQAIIFPPLLFCRIPHGSHIITSIHQQLEGSSSIRRSVVFVCNNFQMLLVLPIILASSSSTQPPREPFTSWGMPLSIYLFLYKVRRQRDHCKHNHQNKTRAVQIRE